MDAAEVGQLLAEGVSVSSIAVRFGCTERTVRNTARRHGLFIPPQARRPTEHRRVNRRPIYTKLWEPGWLQGRFDAGAGLRTIAAEVGCSVGAVRVAADKLGVQRRRAAQRAELRDPAWLSQAYLIDRRSMADIATELGVSGQAVSQALRRAGIVARSQTEAQRPAISNDTARQLYVDEGLSVAQIANRLGVHANTVYGALERAGVPRHGPPFAHSQLGDADWLRETYVDQRRSASSIAAEVGCTVAAVRAALARHHIRRPPPRRPPRRRLAADWKRRRSVAAVARQASGQLETGRAVAGRDWCPPAARRS